MGILQRLFGGSRDEHPAREAQAFEVRVTAADVGAELVELEVKGEASHQTALARIAGPKDPDGKQMAVGVTLRCEPKNSYDCNAIRVEVFGQLVGYCARAQAAAMSAAMQRTCNGAVEARGLIVGGWRDRDSEGHYGIRVWVTTADIGRMGLPVTTFAPPAPAPTRPYPKLPLPVQDEARLTPTALDSDVATVTVTCEEHYQDSVKASCPADWNEAHWPVLLELAPLVNPHARMAEPAVGVWIGQALVGFFTPAMSARYMPMVEHVRQNGRRATAAGQVADGEKGGATISRVRVVLPKVR